MLDPVWNFHIKFFLKNNSSFLNHFQKDKCPRLDGWTIDLFIHFFELFKENILKMVEVSRNQGFISQKISSTYITLIPKKKLSSTFADYCAISLWHMLYKIISKIIATRIRNTLSLHLSLEQHRFLKGRSIIEVVALTQECIHSMHNKKINAALL